MTQRWTVVTLLVACLTMASALRCVGIVDPLTNEIQCLGVDHTMHDDYETGPMTAALFVYFLAILLPIALFFHLCAGDKDNTQPRVVYIPVAAADPKKQ